MTTARTNTSITTRINGQDVICNADGTALFDQGRMMVVSDLHLEKGRALSRTTPMPLYDTDATLRALEDAVTTHQPTRLLMLGDSFHRADMAQSLGADYRARINALAEGREVIWIIGNHDPILPDFLPGDAMQDFVLGGIWFRHIAVQRDDAPLTGGEVSGHYHPKVRIKTKARAISGKCFIHDGQRMIMPAFGAYTGGLSVFDQAIGRYFNGGKKSSSAEILFCHACQIYRYPYSQGITG